MLDRMRRDQGRCREWFQGVMMTLRSIMSRCMGAGDETVEMRAEYNSGFSGEVLIMGELLLT